MSGFLRCFWCRRSGKADEKHFPVQAYQKRRSFGKGEEGKIIVTQPAPVLVGHICRICVKKERKKAYLEKKSKKEDVVLSIKNYR